MRRVATLCALIICLVALAVSTPALAAARDTTTAARGRTLFGVSAVGSGRDSVPAGVAQAFAFKTARTGTVKSVIVYIGAGTGSKRLEAGLYGSRRGQPATLMTSGSLSSVSSGRWAKISVKTFIRHRGDHVLAGFPQSPWSTCPSRPRHVVVRQDGKSRHFARYRRRGPVAEADRRVPFLRMRAASPLPARRASQILRAAGRPRS